MIPIRLLTPFRYLGTAIHIRLVLRPGGACSRLAGAGRRGRRCQTFAPGVSKTSAFFRLDIISRGRAVSEHPVVLIDFAGETASVDYFIYSLKKVY